jgi:hypothetical protein
MREALHAYMDWIVAERGSSLRQDTR